jgi:hypothetical protein
VCSQLYTFKGTSTIRIVERINTQAFKVFNIDEGVVNTRCKKVRQGKAERRVVLSSLKNKVIKPGKQRRPGKKKNPSRPPASFASILSAVRTRARALDSRTSRVMAPFQLRFGLRMSPSRSSDEEEEDDEDEEGFEYEEILSDDGTDSPPPLMMQAEKGGGGLVGAVVGALRRSLVMCSAGKVGEEEDSEDEEEEGMEIGRPTDVRHVSHVTFDRFGGFLGLPADLEPEVPSPTPSAR